MTDDTWKLAQAEIYLLTLSAGDAWNEAPVEDRVERFGDVFLGLVGMLNTMSESLLASLPEVERDELFKRARDRIANRDGRARWN